MGKLVRGLLFCVWLSLSMLPAQAIAGDVPMLGRYLGTLTHDALKQDQAAKLDFVVARRDTNKLALRALLTLQFGAFKQGEYVSYHFDQVEYNLLTGALTFDQADQGVTLVVTRFAGGYLEADVSAATAGRVGTLRLRLDKPVYPKLPFLESVEGEYRGVCGKVEQFIQLYTLKSNEDTTRVGNPFGGNQIAGQLGERNQFCALKKDQKPLPACVTSLYTSGSYNFFTGKLVLQGFPSNLICEVAKDSLGCDNGCRYARVSAPTAPVEIFPRLEKPAFIDPVTPPIGGAEERARIAGTYLGYVHHESRGVYQRVSLTLNTYQSPTETGSKLKMSAIASVYFGEVDDGEAISYKFAPTEYANPIGEPQVVFSRMEGDIDAVIRVTSIGNGVIRGEWFSHLFGRVGRFEVRKTGLPVLAPGARVMERVSARYYDGKFWSLDLGVALDRTPPSTNNPFYPLRLTGFLRGRDELTLKLPIKGGSYDFYTGKIGIYYGDNRLITGRRDGRSEVFLRPVSLGFNTLLLKNDLTRFTKTEE